MASVLFSPGSRIVVVDAGLRKPRLLEDFDMPNLLGLADVLAVPEIVTEKLLEKALKPTGIDNLFLLPAGRTPLDPGALLNSPRLLKVLDLLKAQADLIIIDSAPLLEVVETRAIANAVDGVVVVIYEGRSRGRALKQIVEYFEGKTNNNLLGVVFNGVKLPTYSYSSYAYHRPHVANNQTTLWRKLIPFNRQPSVDSQVLAVAEVADQLGISQETAQRWCEEGRIPAVKNGRQWTVLLEDLNEFINAYQQDNPDINPDLLVNSPASRGGAFQSSKKLSN
jgi:capsular exopolysaccharide synthesis family protein